MDLENVNYKNLKNVVQYNDDYKYENFSVEAIKVPGNMILSLWQIIKAD